MLDYYCEEIMGDEIKLVKKRKKILAQIKQMIKKKEIMRFIFCLIMNENGQVEGTIAKREKIKERIKEQGTCHFKKAHASIAHNDKIYEELRSNAMHNKKLSGTLRSKSFDDGSLHLFLKLLH